MGENRLAFLKESFFGFDIHFSDDFSNAMIINPDWNENILCMMMNTNL